MRIVCYLLAALCAIAVVAYFQLIVVGELSRADFVPFVLAMIGALFFWCLGNTISPRQAGRKGAAKRLAAVPGRAVLYAHIFHQTVRPIFVFSPGDRANMLLLLKEGGEVSQSQVYDAFFSGKNWIWPEYERWKQKFTDNAEFPASWNALLRTEEGTEARNRFVFNFLLQTIDARVDNLLTRRQARSRGVRERVRFDAGSHARYAQDMMAKHPEAVPPYFPGDDTRLLLE